jgi:uncharacterized protein YegP (UPF0339 family)
LDLSRGTDSHGQHPFPKSAGERRWVKVAEFVIKKNASRQYWWRLVAGNGRIIADSGETYTNKSDCRNMVEWIRANARTTPVKDDTGE